MLQLDGLAERERAPAEGAGATGALIVPGVRAHRDERFIGAFARASPSPPGAPLKFVPTQVRSVESSASLRFARFEVRAREEPAEGSAREEVLMRLAQVSLAEFAGSGSPRPGRPR